MLLLPLGLLRQNNRQVFRMLRLLPVLLQPSALLLQPSAFL